MTTKSLLSVLTIGIPLLDGESFVNKVFLALIATVVAAPAFAADSYVSAAFGRAKQQMEVDGNRMSQRDDGFKAAAGFHFAPGAGMELGYASFGELRLSGPGMAAWAKPKSLYAAVVGEAPLTPQFSILGKLGLARTETKVGATFNGVTDYADEKDTSPVIGIGAAYALTNAVKLVAEYENFGKVAKSDGSTLKADMFSVGLRLSF